jgi:hypothetical protein
MNRSGDSDTSATKRALQPEDALAVCTIYPSTGTRAVSELVAERGIIAAGACDTTPRHGFRSNCPD